MESREAPLVTQTNPLISFTINVSPNKFIKNKQWCKYGRYSQESILRQAVQPALENLNLSYVFELTEAGQVHMHGYFQGDMDVANKFQEAMHKKFGMPQLHPDICCTVRTVIDIVGWQVYMNKAQPKKESEDEYIPDKRLF